MELAGFVVVALLGLALNLLFQAWALRVAGGFFGEEIAFCPADPGGPPGTAAPARHRTDRPGTATERPPWPNRASAPSDAGVRW